MILVLVNIVNVMYYSTTSESHSQKLRLITEIFQRDCYKHIYKHYIKWKKSKLYVFLLTITIIFVNKF